MPYHILLAPIIAGFLAQFIKLFLRTNYKKFSYKHLMSYSGMPSGHSALVISLSAIIGLEEGFSSSLFAVSAILAAIVIRDAMGIRRYLGEHGHTLNLLVKDLKDDNVLDERYPHLLERIGHTPAQVLAGSLIGLFVSIAFFLFFGNA